MDKYLKEKISLAFEEDFVGNCIFTPEELTQIYDEAGYSLKRVGGEWGAELSFFDYDMIFIALVNLAKEWNSGEEAFFDYIYRRLLGSAYSGGKIYNQITKLITGLHKSNRIFLLDCYTKKYYATICSHAFAPRHSIESFFEMCWEIYCNDLDQQFEENDVVFELITQSLHNRLTAIGSNEDDFQIGSKIYSFRAGIRGLAIDEPALMTKLLKNTIELIHSLFNSQPIKQDNYYSVLVNEWWKKNESTFGLEKGRAFTRHERSVTDYSQIRAKYILKDGNAKIFIPSIVLKNNWEYEPYIDIKVNGDNFICEPIRTMGSGIIVKTKELEYDLSIFPFRNKINIQIEISHCGDVIYNSKETLNREFILFKNAKEIISQDCLPGIYFLYEVNDLKTLLRYPNDIHRTGINTYSFEAFEGELIQSDKKTVFFSNEESNKDFYFFAKEKNNIFFRCGDEEYKIIDGELYLDVNENIDIKDFGIRYESHAFKLKEFPVENVDGKNRYEVSTLLNVGEKQRISVFKYSDNSVIASINLIKFNNIRVIFDKELYYGKGQKGKVNFITERYNLFKEFNINDEVAIPFENGEIVLSPPILKWRIDDNDWNIQETESALWCREITNSSILYVDLPKSMSCIVALDNYIIEESGKKLEYKLGQTLYSLKNNNQFLKDFLSLFIKINDDKLFFLAKIYIRDSFIEEPLYIFSNINQLHWLPENYIGDKDSKFRLDIIQNSNILFSKELSTTKEIFTLTKAEDGYYKYRITLLSKGFLSKERELVCKDFILGNEKELKYKNKILSIRQVVLFDKIDSEVIRPVYIGSIRYLGNKDSFDYYSGSLFILNKEKKRVYLNKMINERNEIVRINPVRIEIKSENSCYLGYGLDTNDAEFEFDDEFTLDFQRKITICQQVLGEKTRNIDYFLFEVLNDV
jgi:hypothetical protein